MVIASRGLLHHAKSAKSAIKYILSIERHLPEDVRGDHCMLREDLPENRY